MVPTVAVGDHVMVNRLSYGLSVPWLDVHGGFAWSMFGHRELMTWSEPNRGDVVFFRHTDGASVDFVKRIIGRPGDTVELLSGVLFINGVKETAGSERRVDFVDQDCVSHEAVVRKHRLGSVNYATLDITGRGVLADYGPVTVPAGQYFVLGDNRDESADSRVWGFVNRNDIRGRVVFTWMTSDDCVGAVDFMLRPLGTATI